MGFEVKSEGTCNQKTTSCHFRADGEKCIGASQCPYGDADLTNSTVPVAHRGDQVGLSYEVAEVSMDPEYPQYVNCPNLTDSKGCIKGKDYHGDYPNVVCCGDGCCDGTVYPALTSTCISYYSSMCSDTSDGSCDACSSNDGCN